MLKDNLIMKHDSKLKMKISGKGKYSETPSKTGLLASGPWTYIVKTARKKPFWNFISILINKKQYHKQCNEVTTGFYGVVVSTLDFESSDLGSTPGRTLLLFLRFFTFSHLLSYSNLLWMRDLLHFILKFRQFFCYISCRNWDKQMVLSFTADMTKM